MLISCRGASAGPGGAAGDAGTGDVPAVRAVLANTHGVTPPPGWEPLPRVAAAAVATAGEALGGGGTAAAAAWGDRAAGCFGAVIEVVGSRHDDLDRVVGELEHALRAAAEVATWTATPATDAAEVATRFTLGGMTGQARAHLVLDGSRFPHLVAAACFYNDRNPASCAASCDPLLAQLAPPEVSP